MRGTPVIRFRIDFSKNCFVGPGKIDLLEAIRDSGSLSQAARDIGMSYRRAWLLLQAINESFRQPAAIASAGGRGGGGMVLTSFGVKLLSTYRQVQADITGLAEGRLRALAAEVAASAHSRSGLRRRPLGRARPERIARSPGRAPAPRS